MIIFPSGPANLVKATLPSLDPESTSESFRVFCTLVFTFEFTCKAVCIWWVRLELIETELSLDRLVSDAPHAMPLSRCEKFNYWATHGSNMIDFVAILPFWLTLCFGNFLPNASFLRMIRMA